MKNLFVLLLIGLSLASCKKEELYNDLAVEEVVIDEVIPLEGVWKLRSGKMYVENIETHEKTSYNHFDSVKTTSSLRYSGSLYEIEDLVKDSTTWTFIIPKSHIGYGEFWLNNDSLKPYGLNITNSNLSIIEHPTATISDIQMGGSAKPFHSYIEDYDAKLVNFYIHEAYESFDGYNYNYFSILTFEKVDTIP
jgi:hypothetical protein